MLHTPHIIICLIPQTMFCEGGDSEPAHNVVFFIPPLPFPFGPRYHSQHPTLKHPQPMFLPPCETRSHTHIKQHVRL